MEALHVKSFQQQKILSLIILNALVFVQNVSRILVKTETAARPVELFESVDDLQELTEPLTEGVQVLQDGVFISEGDPVGTLI